MNRITADFVYLRMHGSPELYESGYSRDGLQRLAKKINSWVSGERGSENRPRDVYVYFDNDAHGHAPFDARTLGSLTTR